VKGRRRNAASDEGGNTLGTRNIPRVFPFIPARCGVVLSGPSQQSA
jgi:hypothetical protein